MAKRQPIHIPCVGGPLHSKKRSRYGWDGAGGTYHFTSCSAGDFWLYCDGGQDRIYSAYLKTFMP